MRKSKAQRFRKQLITRGVLAGIFFLILLPARAARAQQLRVLAGFNGATGYEPGAVTLDVAGNIYGTNFYGGSNDCEFGCGTVYKVSRHGSRWILTTLYKFHGSDGASPAGNVVFGPDGALYGSTYGGGTGNCAGLGYRGCGTVFKLTPPATFCG